MGEHLPVIDYPLLYSPMGSESCLVFEEYIVRRMIYPEQPYWHNGIFPNVGSWDQITVLMILMGFIFILHFGNKY